jgi:hypothetical protein
LVKLSSTDSSGILNGKAARLRDAALHILHALGEWEWQLFSSDQVLSTPIKGLPRKSSSA